MKRWLQRCPNDDCKLEFCAGEDVIQISAGDHWAGYITPTKDKILGNWHPNCFLSKYPSLFKPQRRPYRCTICRHAIKDKEYVIYAVLGGIPAPPYERAEIRGDELAHIVCRECWQKDPYDSLFRKYKHMFTGIKIKKLANDIEFPSF